MSRPLPTCFVGHGSPESALLKNTYSDALASFSASLPGVKAILVVSAHWLSEHPCLTGRERQEPFYDFYGFPDALYRLKYQPPGAPALAEKIAQLLTDSGYDTQTDPRRGLDHGAWVPLRLMWPAADIPVLQLSIQPGRDPHWHYRLGQALAPLREQGVLLLASGSTTHNLRDLAGMRLDSPPARYASDFVHWLNHALDKQQLEALLDYRHQAPHATRAHPTDEHLLPLYVALGAAAGEPWHSLHQSWQYGVIHMALYRFG